jgi:hypothetical protein
MRAELVTLLTSDYKPLAGVFRTPWYVFYRLPEGAPNQSSYERESACAPFCPETPAYPVQYHSAVELGSR